MGPELLIAGGLGGILRAIFGFVRNTVGQFFLLILSLIYEALRNGFVILTKMVAAPIQMNLDEFKLIIPFATKAYKWVLWFGIAIAVLILITQLFIGMFTKEGKEHPVKLLFTTALTIIFMFLAPTVFDAGLNFARVPYDGLSKVIKDYEPSPVVVQFFQSLDESTPMGFRNTYGRKVEQIITKYVETHKAVSISQPYLDNVTVADFRTMQAHAEKLVQEMGNASAPTDMIEDVKSEIKFFDMCIKFWNMEASQGPNADLSSLETVLTGAHISAFSEEIARTAVEDSGGEMAMINAEDEKFENESLGYMIVAFLLSILFIFFIGWNYIKLLLECVERYLLLGVLYFTAPIPIAAGVSENTRPVLKSWIRMCVSQVLVLFFTMWFLWGASSVISFAFFYIKATPRLTIFYLAIVVAYLKLGQHIDEFFGILGMSAAKTGGSLLEDVGMMRLMVMDTGRAFGAAREHFAKGGKATSDSVTGVFSGDKPPSGVAGAGSTSQRKVNNEIQRNLGFTESVKDGQVSNGRYTGTMVAPDGSTSSFVARAATAEEISGEKSLYKNEALQVGKDGHTFVVANVPGRDFISANKANLDGLNFEGANMSGMDLSGAHFNHSSLAGADMSEANLNGAIIENSSVDGVNASGSQMDGFTMLNTEGAMDLSNATITNNSVINGDLSGSKVEGLKIADSSLKDTNLSGAQGSGMSIERTHMQGVEIRGSDTNLEGISIKNSTMNSSIIGGGANLSGASIEDLRGTGNNLDRAQVNGAALKDVNLQNTSAQHTSFHNSTLSDVTLSGETKAQGADFGEAKLNRVDMSGSDLKGASFAGAQADTAKLRSTDLTGSDLRFASVGKGVDVTDAKYDKDSLPNRAYTQKVDDNMMLYTSGIIPGMGMSAEAGTVEAGMPDTTDATAMNQNKKKAEAFDWDAEFASSAHTGTEAEQFVDNEAGSTIPLSGETDAGVAVGDAPTVTDTAYDTTPGAEAGVHMDSAEHIPEGTMASVDMNAENTAMNMDAEKASAAIPSDNASMATPNNTETMQADTLLTEPKTANTGVAEIDEPQESKMPETGTPNLSNADAANSPAPLAANVSEDAVAATAVSDTISPEHGAENAKEQAVSTDASTVPSSPMAQETAPSQAPVETVQAPIVQDVSSSAPAQNNQAVSEPSSAASVSYTEAASPAQDQAPVSEIKTEPGAAQATMQPQSAIPQTESAQGTAAPVMPNATAGAPVQDIPAQTPSATVLPNAQNVGSQPQVVQGSKGSNMQPTQNKQNVKVKSPRIKNKRRK